MGSTRLCQKLPSTHHTQDTSQTGDLLEPEEGIKFQSGRGQRIQTKWVFLRLVVFAKSRIEVQPTSCPHSMKMKGIRFPELPMITSSGKALHSYPSMSIFKITSSASMLAWLKRGKKECNAQGVKIDIFVGKCSQNSINIACVVLFLI